MTSPSAVMRPPETGGSCWGGGQRVGSTSAVASEIALKIVSSRSMTSCGGICDRIAVTQPVVTVSTSVQIATVVPSAATYVTWPEVCTNTEPEPVGVVACSAPST